MLRRDESKRRRIASGTFGILEDFPVFPINNKWDDSARVSWLIKIYVVQTASKVIQRAC